MKFLNLLTDELKRARVFYLLLLGGIILLETLGVGYNLLTTRQEIGAGESVYHTLDTLFDISMYYGLIVGGAVFALIMYAIFTWVKEWYFQGNYMYRLLILPGNRAPIAFAKVASIIMMMAGVLIVQLGIFYVANWAAGLMMGDYYLSAPVLVQLAQNMAFSYVLFPLNPVTTILNYTFGLAFLIILMNNCIIILSHRGHGLLKSIALTIIYDAIMVGILIGVIFFTKIPLTQTEMTMSLVAIVVTYCAINSGFMYWLMNHYISV